LPEWDWSWDSGAAALDVTAAASEPSAPVLELTVVKKP
jgi:hypothetical protein